MIKQTVHFLRGWFKNRTDDQKGWISFAFGVLLSYIFRVLFQMTLLYVISSLFIIWGGIYWFLDPAKRHIRPIFKKILLVMFTFWLIFLVVEFYLRILHIFRSI